MPGKVVAITGASAGIGRALACHLVRRGDMVAAFARRRDRLDALAAELSTASGRIVTVCGDVTIESDVERLVAAATEAFGRIDVMVCNAGIGYHGTLDATPPDVIRRVMAVNTLGTMYAARAALEPMRRQGRGHIIAISSIVARRGVAGAGVYAASKAAQLAFIESLRAEFLGTGLCASVVFPVSTTTEFRAAIIRDFNQRVHGHGPKQTPDQVAAAVVACIDRPRPEVYPFRWAKVLAVLSVIAPGRADWIVRRFRRTTTDSHAGPIA